MRERIYVLGRDMRMGMEMGMEMGIEMGLEGMAAHLGPLLGFRVRRQHLSYKRRLSLQRLYETLQRQRHIPKRNEEM